MFLFTNKQEKELYIVITNLIIVNESSFCAVLK